MTGIDQEQVRTDPASERRNELAGRLFQATLGLFDIFAVYLGDRLGRYRALAEAGSVTLSELARRTSTGERYIREWLEQQAASSLLEVENVGAAVEARHYRLPAGHEEVLLDRESLSYMTGLARLAVGAGIAGPGWDLADCRAVRGRSHGDNLNPVGRLYYAASTLICTPASLAQPVGAALGAQAGEARLRELVSAAGFSRLQRAAETPFNVVLEARP